MVKLTRLLDVTSSTVFILLGVVIVKEGRCRRKGSLLLRRIALLLELVAMLDPCKTGIDPAPPTRSTYVNPGDFPSSVISTTYE
jgi:hypothetical protein